LCAQPCEDCAPIELCDFGYSYQSGADPLYQALAVWHWHSSFIHCGWCLDLVLTTEATMENCQKLCQPLLKCPRPGSVCLIEVVTRYGTFGIQSASFFFCKQEIVDLICGEIDCEHKLVDWFVQSGDLNDHFTFRAHMFVVSQIGKFCLLCSNERMQFYLFETSFQVSHLQNNLCMMVMGVKHI
jgi:hypothetical protein